MKKIKSSCDKYKQTSINSFFKVICNSNSAAQNMSIKKKTKVSRRLRYDSVDNDENEIASEESELQDVSSICLLNAKIVEVPSFRRFRETPNQVIISSSKKRSLRNKKGEECDDNQTPSKIRKTVSNNTSVSKTNTLPAVNCSKQTTNNTTRKAVKQAKVTEIPSTSKTIQGTNLTSKHADGTKFSSVVKLNSNHKNDDVWRIVQLNSKLKKSDNAKVPSIKPQTPKKIKSPSKLKKNDNSEVENFMHKTFQTILDFVKTHDHFKTLLYPDEVTLLNNFSSLSNNYKLYCIKLYMRKLQWYNLYKFASIIKLDMNDEQVGEMYTSLMEQNFIISDYSNETTSALLSILAKNDLKRIADVFKLNTKCKKNELVQKLIKNCARQSTLTKDANVENALRIQINRSLGICVKLNQTFYMLLKKIHCLYYFTSGELQTDSDLHYFLSRKYKREIILPNYQVDKFIKIFPSKKVFNDFFEAQSLFYKIEVCYQNKSFSEILESAKFAYNKLLTINHITPEIKYYVRFTAEYKYTSVLSLAAKHLASRYPNEVVEFLRCLLAQRRYCLSFQGKWYESLVARYCQLKKYQEAGETLLCGLKTDSLSDVDFQSLSLQAKRIEKQIKNTNQLLHDEITLCQKSHLQNIPSIKITAKVVHGNKKGKSKYIIRGDQEREIYTVEGVALNEYIRKGFPKGIHCEGRLFSILFFTLFWDIIYNQDVKGVFIQEVQYCPIDFKSEFFYSNRKDLIDKRLEDIKTLWTEEQFSQHIQNSYTEHSQIKPLKDLTFFDHWSELLQVASCVGRVPLGVCMERIAKNYRLYHSGLPDLFVWNPENQRCKFVEVKGDRDKLSVKQMVWLDFLQKAGVSVEVCHVHSIGSKYKVKSLEQVNQDDSSESVFTSSSSD